MANICDTVYEIHGSKEQLNKLENALNKAKEICKERNLKYIDNYFDDEKQNCENDKQLEELKEDVARKRKCVNTDPWVSDLYEALTGKDYDDYCSDDGQLTYISCSDDRISIDIESNWMKVEAFEDMLRDDEDLEDLSIFYLTEEFGCGIWETNDTIGDVFDNKYYVELDGDGDYFDNDDDLLEFVNDYFFGKYDFHDVKSFKDYIDSLDPESEECYFLIELERI